MCNMEWRLVDRPLWYCFVPFNKWLPSSTSSSSSSSSYSSSSSTSVAGLSFHLSIALNLAGFVVALLPRRLSDLERSQYSKHKYHRFNPYRIKWNFIIAETSREQWAVLNQRQSGCLFNSSSRSILQQSSVSLGLYLGNQWLLADIPHKGPVMRKAFPCQIDIM